MNGLISFFNGAVCHGCGMGVTIMVLLMLDVHVVGSPIFSLSYRSMFFTGCHSICDFSSNDHNLSFLLFLLSKKKI
jgi:hypothetical protein